VLVVYLVHGRVPMAEIISTKLLGAARFSISLQMVGIPGELHLNQHQ
jgi:hypothetical protein